MARSVAGGAAPSRLNRKFLVVAVLLAVLSAVLVYAKISATSDSSKSSSGGAGTLTVVVTKAAIEPRTLLTAEQVELKSLPSGAVIPGAYASIADAVGKTVKYPIQANSQVTTDNVIDTSKPATDSSLSLVIPQGKRAMSIQASQVSNVGGLILPGDFVDIIWSCCQGQPVVIKTILHNVQVAAVAQTVVNSGPVAGSTPTVGGSSPVATGSGKPIPEAQTVTLLLTPNEAERLFLAEQNGTLRADLRGVSDQDTTDPGLVKMFDLISPPELVGVPDSLKPNGFKPGQ